MSSIVILAGSPSTTSRTVALTEYLAGWLRADGHEVRLFRVRDLPAQALLTGDATDPAIAAVVDAITDADGVLVASGVYKASYSGVLKALLDLLPQYALAGKVVLPVMIGGTTAHVLAVDYALRPVLCALGSEQVVPGWFVLDSYIEMLPDGVRLAPEAATPLMKAVDTFRAAFPRTLAS